ncbi:SDR family NAD(P)-dependent oxidoreductase [Candidatus Rhabdochlamydia sp. T3358]|uniref:SDR family NAD(P)-dependent oxidoreductase n=1 Tax=Candidatus Rhabdochlamydia sp. T3358 TaxID=2099795 RepID=UPI0010B9C3B3|nr:SDR family NAD(P)-dependent oxidoreductase [Candidatus Rhabdochlamydia sp. T3358]VHO02126.1 short chain dehydrogenase [Candidatus Rhabdochlamydia sp. T3358]
MAYRLASKIALITGAAQEIGRSCAELFAKEGTFVFVYDERFRDHQNIVLDIYIGI